MRTYQLPNGMTIGIEPNQATHMVKISIGTIKMEIGAAEGGKLAMGLASACVEAAPKPQTSDVLDFVSRLLRHD